MLSITDSRSSSNDLKTARLPNRPLFCYSLASSSYLSDMKEWLGVGKRKGTWGRDWCLCSIRRTGRTWLESHSLQTPSCALCRWGDDAFTPLLTHKHFIQAALLSCLFFSPEHFCLCPGPLLPRLTSLLSGSGPGSTVSSKCSKCLDSPGRALTPSYCLSLVAFYCAPLSTYL